MVQLLAGLYERRLRIVNCHQHTEASDFLGGYRPSRNLPKAIARAVGAATALLSNAALCSAASAACVGLLREVFGCGSGDLGALDVARLIERACRELRGLEEALLQPSTALSLEAQLATRSLARCVAEARGDLADAARVAALPFEWADGPLVEAMKQGDVLLIDEINLAEDAVLERLNSVFETERTLTLTEKVRRRSPGSEAELHSTICRPHQLQLTRFPSPRRAAPTSPSWSRTPTSSCSRP